MKFVLILIFIVAGDGNHPSSVTTDHQGFVDLEICEAAEVLIGREIADKKAPGLSVVSGCFPLSVAFANAKTKEGTK
jgi:hypothetical protein